jgi:hypothetical protein
MTLLIRPTTDTYLLAIRPAKIQFVDQGPELENFYAQDEDYILGDVPRDPALDSLDDTESSLKRSLTSSTIRTSLSPDTRLPVDRNHQFSILPILSPTSTLHSGSNPRSPLKRGLPDDSFGPTAHRRVDNWQTTVYDPVRTTYRIYDTPKVPHSFDHDISLITESINVPKSVEAEYRRLADSAAALIPDESLLTPAIWKEQFYWPNGFTTTQCACLMRYFIEKLAPWVCSLSKLPIFEY